MEAVIALLLTVGVACLIGLRAGRDRRLDDDDASALGSTYAEYLRAVSAAGLVRLSNVVGDVPAREDIEASINGPRLLGDMIELLEGATEDAVIDDTRVGSRETVGTLLARLTDDAEKYWPDQLPPIQRARESLS
ncbi:MAG TPA: hypothetical protein VFB51_08350 [Solirubrobacterales bacterium]|nr:hypothetical protein [Solirubrobacterales bacterium]